MVFISLLFHNFTFIDTKLFSYTIHRNYSFPLVYLLLPVSPHLPFHPDRSAVLKQKPLFLPKTGSIFYKILYDITLKHFFFLVRVALLCITQIVIGKIQYSLVFINTFAFFNECVIIESHLFAVRFFAICVVCHALSWELNIQWCVKLDSDTGWHNYNSYVHGAGIYSQVYYRVRYRK